MGSTAGACPIVTLRTRILDGPLRLNVRLNVLVVLGKHSGHLLVVYVPLQRKPEEVEVVVQTLVLPFKDVGVLALQD